MKEIKVNFKIIFTDVACKKDIPNYLNIFAYSLYFKSKLQK
jgi:hypothetical protein